MDKICDGTIDVESIDKIVLSDGSTVISQGLHLVFTDATHNRKTVSVGSDILDDNKAFGELLSKNGIIINKNGTTGVTTIKSEDGTVKVDTTELPNGVQYDLSVNTDIIATKESVANKKDRQNELTFDGSATKTVKKITQDANGVINVEFEDVDLKDHIKSEYPIEIKSSASGTYVTLTLDGKVLFVAEYGKTTYAELRKHIERKDILILNVNGTDYCTNYNISDSFIEFYNNVIDNCVNTTKRYVLNSNNVWIYTTDTASKMQLNSGSVSVGEDGTINIGSSNKVTISSPSLNIGTGSLEGNLPTLVYKDIVKNINSNIPLVLFGTNKSDKLQTNSSIPDYSGMTTFFAGYEPSMGSIIDYVNNNVSKLKVLMKNDVTYDIINTMYSASPYLPILNDGTQYYYPHYAAPGYGFSWFNFSFMGKDQKMSTIYYYFLSPDNTWSQSYMMIPSEGYDNTDITTIVSSQKVIAVLKTETIDIEV